MGFSLLKMKKIGVEIGGIPTIFSETPGFGDFDGKFPQSSGMFLYLDMGRSCAQHKPLFIHTSAGLQIQHLPDTFLFWFTICKTDDILKVAISDS